jgi:hypothetical protein
VVGSPLISASCRWPSPWPPRRSERCRDVRSSTSRSCDRGAMIINEQGPPALRQRSGKRALAGLQTRGFRSASRASEEPASGSPDSNVGRGSASSNATLPFVAVPASTEPDDVHPTHFCLKCPYENQARGFPPPANAGRAGSSVCCGADTCRLRRRDDQCRHFFDAVGTTARA